MDSARSLRSALQEPPREVIYTLMGLMLVYAIVRSVLAAAGKPLGFNELFTVTVSDQGSWSGIIKSLLGAADSHPPLFYMIEHWASMISKNKEIAMRLPSILAIPCTLTCVYVYVKRGSGEAIAFLCMAFLLMTNVFQGYAVEARAYSMVVACIAFASVCYQRASAPMWALLFAISLVLAESLHYMAVLAMVPFGIAEAVLLLKMRRFRWPVWSAMIVGVLPLLLFWNLLASFKARYGPGLYSRDFQFSFIPRMYGEFFLTDSRFGAGLAAVALAGVLGVALWGPEKDAKDGKLKFSEATLLLMLAALPFIGYFVVVRAAHSGLAERYVLSTVIGMSMALGYILSKAKSGAVALVAIFIFSVVGIHELHFWRFIRRDIQSVALRGTPEENFIEASGHKQLPVVIPNGVLLLPLVYYAPRSFVDRLVYPKQDAFSPDDRNWQDTEEKGVEGLHLPLHITDFLEFTRSHKEFLVYVEERDPGRDWLTLRLSREGWSLQTIALNEWQRMYLVRSNENPDECATAKD
jgi:hypothetical protein